VAIVLNRHGLNRRAETVHSLRVVVAIDPNHRAAVIVRNRQAVAIARNLLVAAATVRLRRVAITTGRSRARGPPLTRNLRTTTGTKTTVTEFGWVNTHAVPRCLGIEAQSF
jgi:hypothetical protein